MKDQPPAPAGFWFFFRPPPTSSSLPGQTAPTFWFFSSPLNLPNSPSPQTATHFFLFFNLSTADHQDSSLLIKFFFLFLTEPHGPDDPLPLILFFFFPPEDLPSSDLPSSSSSGSFCSQPTDPAPLHRPGNGQGCSHRLRPTVSLADPTAALLPTVASPSIDQPCSGVSPTEASQRLRLFLHDQPNTAALTDLDLSAVFLQLLHDRSATGEEETRTDRRRGKQTRNEEEERKINWKQRTKIKIDCLCCVFAWSAGRCRRGEEVDPAPCCWVFFSVAACEPTRRQWRWRVGGRAATVPAFQKDSPAIPGVFRGCFVI